MRPRTAMILVALATMLGLWSAGATPAGSEAKKLVFWTHWEQNPGFNKFYETRGKDSQRTPA